ncbi:sensor histidine kinase [Brochothrix thermosphacta]|uniref:sensor histidine kinase n=1 Tax=Brochothrix thermosphacta TaxID=2756 RepID=UPI000A1B47FA|nr:sensor histidine kinase [Brochothrix thermosphacta]MDO7863154.1 sensor histidine kinase [Brochothrix thermosphacta]SLM96620.1 Two-component sensor kinase YesM [Brachybacterium faecium]
MKQTNLMNTLLRIYAVVMIIIITLFTLIVGYTIFQTYVEDAQKDNEQTANFLTDTVNNLEQQTDLIVDNLLNDSKSIENLYEYFNLGHAEYLRATLKREGTEQRYWPQMVKQLYQLQTGIGGIQVSLNDFDETYYSNQSKKAGEKIKALPQPKNQLVISKPITQTESINSTGTFSLIADEAMIKNIITSMSGARQQQILIYSQTDQLMYSYTGNKVTKPLDARKDLKSIISLKENVLDDNYFMTQNASGGNLKVVVLTPKNIIYEAAFKNYSWILMGSLLLDGILLIILFRTFGAYSRQVEDILVTMNHVTDSNLSVRINEENKQRELKEIAVGINLMLDDINQQVKDIYLLEIEQKDAHMRALQSQINPHFLYNTLEYIRMYAVSEGVDELAEVVYSFASLLRNNTMQEKTVTLQRELEFCEKYVFLYQMRYPDRIAYHFTVDSEIDDVMVPKYIVQPLIENYFVHGIDFSRIDNAISVKVYRKNTSVVIDVIDNGKGMSDERLTEVNRLLVEDVSKERHQTSIGLMNVSDRLKLVFGDNATMVLYHNLSGGVIVRLTFEEEITDV